GPPGELLREAVSAARAVFSALGPGATDCDAIVISENVPATERVLHLEPRERARLDDATGAIAGLSNDELPGVTGVTTLVRGNLQTMRGQATVTDSADQLLGDASGLDTASWTRRAPAFFQANRFLV